jgi:hypothetical protein
MESLQRRQLEARRLSESSPIAGMGTYQLMRPARGREVLRSRKLPPRPPRVPNGSDAFGLIASNRDIQDLPLPPPRSRPEPVTDSRADLRAPLVVQRTYRAEIAPPPAIEPTPAKTGWALPLSLATAVSTVILALALWLR